MRRRRVKGLVAVSFAVLGSVATSGEASAAAMVPGPPTAVQATYVAGAPGVTVSWGPPVSNGGSPILYYTASNYNGHYFCISFTSGRGTCHIDGIEVIASWPRPQIRVKAVSAAGRGPVVLVFPVVAQKDPVNANASISNPSGTGATSASHFASAPSSTTVPSTTLSPTTLPSTTSASGTIGVATTATSASAGVYTELPYSGADVQALFIVGVSLVLGGMTILSPLGRRRRGEHLD